MQLSSETFECYFRYIYRSYHSQRTKTHFHNRNVSIAMLCVDDNKNHISRFGICVSQIGNELFNLNGTKRRLSTTQLICFIWFTGHLLLWVRFLWLKMAKWNIALKCVWFTCLRVILLPLFQMMFLKKMIWWFFTIGLSHFWSYNFFSNFNYNTL